MHSDEQKLMPSLKNGCPSISSPQKSHRIGILKLWLTSQPDFFHRNKYPALAKASLFLDESDLYNI
jgi:hypothetical protein